MNNTVIDNQTKLDIEERAKQMADTEYTRQDKEAWSAAVYREIANDNLPTSVRMKEDTPGANTNGKLPTLDTEIYIENGFIRNNHYSKPMHWPHLRS